MKMGAYKQQNKFTILFIDSKPPISTMTGFDVLPNTGNSGRVKTRVFQWQFVSLHSF